MRLDSYTKEMMDENAFIDMSHIYLEDLGKETDLYDIIDKFKEIGGYSDDEIESRILQFYTDLNTDGRFISTGDGVWGLRDWYSVSDISEKIAPTIHKIDLSKDDDFIDEDLEVEDEEEDEDKGIGREFFNETTKDEDIDSDLDDDTDLDDAVDEVETEIEYDDTDDLEDNYDDDNDEI